VQRLELLHSYIARRSWEAKLMAVTFSIQLSGKGSNRGKQAPGANVRVSADTLFGMMGA
jgi:hypothetical protein